VAGDGAFPYAEFAHQDPGLEKIARKLLANVRVVTALDLPDEELSALARTSDPARVRIRPGPLLAFLW
jgi:hypothetical protein